MTHRVRTTALAILTVLVALALVGCGASSKAPSADESASTAPVEDRAQRDGDPCSDESEDEGSGQDDASSFAVEAPPPAGDGPITVVDGRGEEVTLHAPATRVVTIEWSYTEYLLALGVQPVGVADVENYELYVTEDPPLADDVTDIGTRQEPSIEQIRLLQPDLIIADEGRSAASVEALASTGAAVLAFPTYEAGADQLDAMVESFLTVAQAVDRGEEAVAVLGELDEAIVEARTTLAEADLPTRDVVLAQGEGTVEAPMFRLFTDSSMAVQLLATLCLTNSIGDDSADAGTDYGYVSVSLEGLTRVGDAWFLPIAPDDAVEEFEARFADSPAWANLGFVQADRLRLLGEDTWLFGGPLSAQLLVERVATALTG